MSASNLRPRQFPAQAACASLLAALAGAASIASAASADIATEPLTNSPAASIRPNLMFVLDDSGSMSFDFAPDVVGLYKYQTVSRQDPPESDKEDTKLCFGVVAVNPVFYDPNFTYPLPLKSNGDPFPNASFTGAWRDGFDQSKGTVDLSVLANVSSPNTQVGVDASKKAVYSRFYYATYTGPGSKPRCGDPNWGPFPGTYDYKNFNVVTDASGWSDAQKTNYANWYSYYRNRMLLMRSGTGTAFARIDAARYRVGYSTISDGTARDSSTFLNIRDFDSGTQKADFFSRLYGATPSGGTPLRTALAKAGRYYANQLSGGGGWGDPSWTQVDPVQYSCQRNYTILSTDGYWNDRYWNGSHWIDGEGSAVQLNGSSKVGNQDGGTGTPRPQRDDINGSGKVGGAGVSNTLADVAMYYYKTDLRTTALGNCSVTRNGVSVDVCNNDVVATTADPADWQHMVTFTVGLGVSGTLTYDANYETQTSGSFFDIKNGTVPWPDPIANTGAERIDDLWHAAVNGRGRYFSASNPTALSEGLTRALGSINIDKAAGTPAALSNLQPTSGDDDVYLAGYYDASWDGDIIKKDVDPETGVIQSTVSWSARVQLLAQSAASRKIYIYSGAAANKLAPFEYNNLSATQKASFDNLCPSSGAVKLSQCLTLSAANQAKVTATALIDFLRGDRSKEAAPSATEPLFRYRYNEKEKFAFTLGDIVNSAPVYVSKPKRRYTDSGHADFVTAQKDRKGVVYAGANDGMLHAFDASSGNELWAYIPSMVIPNLYKLADTSYATKHQYYVDGAVWVGDVKGSDDAWRTVLIGGLNGGGRGYYALDITNPDSPVALWEFTDTDLGLSFGNPILTQTKGGTWVAVFPSGYNNVNNGNGRGYLYVLNAVTGAQLAKIDTGAGSTTTPSNLGRINTWVDDDTHNVTERVYGGDMLGNVWRFDIADANPSNWAAVLLGRAQAPDGTAQPITVRPELAEVKVGTSRYKLVSVGTGRFLGSTDFANKQVQSVYTIKDTGATTGLGVMRDNTAMVKQTLSAFTTDAGVTGRTSTTAEIDWTTKSGWFVDFTLGSGERVDIEMQQQLNRLYVVTDTPDPNACGTDGASGTSWLYVFDLRLGAAPKPAGGLLATKIANALAAGQTIIQTSGKKEIKDIVCARDGTCVTVNDREADPSDTLRRTSWRELAN